MSNVWDEENSWGDTDPFKLQNELAQTMQSIHLSGSTSFDHKEEDEEQHHNNDDEEDIKSEVEEEHYSPQDHVHYEDESTADVGNPFLVNGNEPERERVDIGLLKEKKNQLLESLTSDAKDDSFLKPETVDNVDELFTGSEDTKVGKLMSLASTTAESEDNDAKSNEQKNDHTAERLQSRIISPTRKVKLLRPRRVKLQTEIVIDPLSAPLSASKDASNCDVANLASPHTMKQKLISESEAPLFNIKKEDILDNTELNRADESSKNSAEDKVEIIKEEEAESFEITVGDPIKVGELTNAHVMYTITTKTSSEFLTYPETTVTRRYSDFLWLYNRLLNNHPGYIIPPPPEKQAYGRFDDKFIENRRLVLEKMLRKITSRSVFQKDKDLQVFLQSESFTADSKKSDIEEQNRLDDIKTMSQLLSININLGISETTNGGGFFGSLIGLSTSKYVEEDPFILGKQEYIKNLDQQLRQLSQSLDMILEKREELSNSVSDVTLVIQQLADLEINSEISEILVNFEELQVKIKELLDNRNMSQILTFGSTIDEYIRKIGSVRNCFENRLKICNSLTILQQHKNKKEHSLIKFKSKNSSQVDKISVYETELDKYNKFYDLQVQFKENFDTIFKSELKQFEVAKVKNFKNMIEIYWESLIENQKLLIELWETFYDKCSFD